MQPDTVATLMKKLRQLYAMFKKLQNFKNGSNFVCEKGTFSQIRSQLTPKLAFHLQLSRFHLL